MLGIRRRNYEHDIAWHTQAWPSYPEFLDLRSWEQIADNSVRHTLMQRAEFDPVYHQSLLPQLKKNWPGAEYLKQNYSQSWQDWFVLTVLEGKKNGYWLELGASDPVYMNNTYLLESEFGWRGISIDFRHELIDQWVDTRSTTLQTIDALHYDYHDCLKDSPEQIDYLQLDLADWATLESLQKLPHDKHRFSVITFEHDIFQADPDIRSRSRQFLRDLGYFLLISNVAVKNYATQTWEPFEDWWIDPRILDPKDLCEISDTSDDIKLPHSIFLHQ